VCHQICSSKDELQALQASLKTTPCPHCKSVGYLIRHGFLRGYDDSHSANKTIRATRVFCSNRHRANGCGKTFSVWIADKIKRLFVGADNLMAFLKEAVSSDNKLQAFRKLNSGLSDSVAYRIWKRFLLAQSRIRTALTQLCDPPRITSSNPITLTLVHLQEAFRPHWLSPIAAFQVAMRSFFV
jgi:hypothetical protein